MEARALDVQTDNNNDASDDDDKQPLTNSSSNPIIHVIDHLQLGTQFGAQMAIQYFRKVLTPEEFENPFIIRTYSSSTHRLYRLLHWFLEIYETLQESSMNNNTTTSSVTSSSSSSRMVYCKSVLHPPNPWQKGCPEVIPYLSTYPWWLINNRDPCSGTDKRTTQSSGSTTFEDTKPVFLLPFSTSADITPDHPYYSSLAFIHELEAATPQIRQEVLSLRGLSVFQTYRAPDYKEKNKDTSNALSTDIGSQPSPDSSRGMEGTDRGLWNIYYLDLHHTIDKEKNEKLCPVTMSILKRIPRLYGHAMFSAMAPNTHITTHTGPTNRKLRIHLPLFVPFNSSNDHPLEMNNTNINNYCRLRVGPHTEIFKEGSCVIFDDSFQHEAWNDYQSSSTVSSSLSSSSSIPFLPSRINLIIDIWHPDLTNDEIKILNFIRSSQIRKAKAMSEAGLIPIEADFFKILQESHSKGIDDTVVFGNSMNLKGTDDKNNSCSPEDSSLTTDTKRVTAGVDIISRRNTDIGDSSGTASFQPLESVSWKDD